MNEKENIIDKIDRLAPGTFSQLDRQFADFLCELSQNNDPEFILGSRLVSRFTSDGHICLDIPSISGRNIFEILEESPDSDEENLLYNEDDWIRKITKNPAVGKPGEFKPLILDESGRLYLYKYWQYEQKLAENIKKRLYNDFSGIDLNVLHDSLFRLFDSDKDTDQRNASIVALLRKFCVISGGPGTGKTSTVIKILIMLIEQAGIRKEHLRIAIAAPTGKAAARINESIKEAVNLLNYDQHILKYIPGESFTIHRLLRFIPGSPYFFYNNKNPLPYDVIVVDESSMADLALISKLFDAVPQSSRIILLGDKDQLASVEAGAVLGDICDLAKSRKYSTEFSKILKNISDGSPDRISVSDICNKTVPELSDSIALLNKNYRFKKNSGIKELSRLIKAGDADSVIEILKSNRFDDISFSRNLPVDTFKSFVSGKIVSGYTKFLKSDNPGDAISEFRNFTVLCALRKGQYGVEQINRLAEESLKRKGLISAFSQWYERRPVMIVRNDYNVKLYNGDIGIIFKDENSGMYFYIKSGSTLRKIVPMKLPEHETVFSMTVHKSQGSEFNNVLLVLPENPLPLLTREMLYTAVTRARDSVEICGSEFVIRYMIENPTNRISGLRDSLWK
ncbi:MAG: exodeoxyribonuclease V subunit alpha [Spirochaetes bacterium]|nr:exodeoxyribonuclease V subunit alpha [Spirochaetota bacterium]